MSVAAVLRPADYESRVQRYLFERAEEARAVRVGEKEVSERAAIVARYAELFTRDQLESLRQAEEESAAGGEERERLYRLRKTCEAGLISGELAGREDALENAILAARVQFRGEELPLRTAQARLAVLPGYADRDELGRLAHELSATFNEDRRELLRAGEEDRKSTRLNSSHANISYAVFCLKKKRVPGVHAHRSGHWSEGDRR